MAPFLQNSRSVSKTLTHTKGFSMKTTTLLTATLFALTLGACSSTKKDDKEIVEIRETKVPMVPTKAPDTDIDKKVPETKKTTTQAPKEEPVVVVEKKEEKKEEPAKKETKQEPKKEETKPEHKEETVQIVGKCHFVDHRNHSHDFEIKCSEKIHAIVYGRMTIGQSLNIQAHGIGIHIVKHDDALTIEGSVTADRVIKMTIVFEDESRQDIEFHDERAFLK